MKFKSTTRSPRALLYKRFIGIEKSFNSTFIYNTVSDNLYWAFDYETLTFSKLKIDDAYTIAKEIVLVSDFKVVLQYQSNYFRYNGIEWEKITEPGKNIILLSATFNNVGRYQTNKYYYCGSFDFMVKGSVEGTKTQYIKGNIIPLTSLDIKHFDDNIQLTEDDLVVVEGHLYSVENPATDIKHQPKDYKVYFATLNSIL